MTQDQYNKAIEINNRLKELNLFLDYLKHYSKPILCYSSYNNISCTQVICYDLIYKLEDIFIRHDKMIREEIKNEIKKLKDEIKIL